MHKFFHDEPHFFDDLKFFHQAYSESVQFQVQSTEATDVKEIFEQAVYCLLTPATKSDSAEHTYRQLFDEGRFYHATELELSQILREPPYIRFHNQKAERLMFWRENGIKLVSEFMKLPTALEKRAYIVNNVKGMNFKEATHYLRNIGLSENLVILDRHILNFMKKVELLSGDNLFSKLSAKYFQWEEIFVEFVFNGAWKEIFPHSTIPQADFAIWASYVKKSDPKITRERILLLK